VPAPVAKGGDRAVSESTEDALVAAARAGGTWAFGQLWVLLAPRVAAYVRARGVADVDDVTSEVFLAAFARIGEFVGEGAQFRRYVFTLAHHKAVDDIRRRFSSTARQTVPFSDEVDPRRAPSAEDLAGHFSLDPDLATLLDSLPPLQRDVLLLRVVAGLDLADVAELIGRTEGATKQLQHRALTGLRRQLPAHTTRPASVTAEAVPPIAGAI
jgi:RNA polymerase sigma factor (sigma-70 family)